MKQIYYLAIACLLLLSSAVLPAWAQQRLVQGTVQDEKGETLPGVAIRVAGTTVAVTTDPNGVFKINVPPNRNTLVFSYMGMKTKEVILNGQSQLTVTLQAASNSLDEVVVVGYGTVKRRDLTGAVASVKGESLLKTVPISVNQALQGQLAGVDVQRNDGAPGSGISIQIRGANSFASSTEPLYVIDGIPFTTAGTPANVANNQNMAQTINPLATLNPADIESVEVLKDASSTAIYGSRGANGVVLITTKKGKAGQDKIEFSANSSFNQISKKLKILNAYQYAQFQNEAVTNQNNYEGTNKGLPYSGLPYVDPLTGNTYISPKPEDFLTGTKGAKTADGFKGTDWQNEIFQNSFTQDYTLRLSGGNDKGTYAVSGNYVDQPGIIVNSGFKRYGTQINIARKVHDWIEIGTNNNISRNIYRLAKTNSDASNVINSALHFPTTMPVFDESTASGTSQVDWFSANPYLYVRQAKDITNSTGIYSSSYLKLNFSKNLNFQQNLGYNYSQNTRNVYYNRYLSEGKDPVNGVASKADDSWQGVTLESILNYNKTFAGKHNLAATGVFSYETGQYISKSMYAKNFPNDILEDNDIGSALDQPIVRSNKGENALLSFMGRVNYNFSNKYFLTATFRRDGSSKFATQNKWGNFPSLAAAYTVSEESFLKKNPVISNLKVRGSWGQTGNQSIGAYATADRLTTANAVINGSRVSGFSNVGPTDPDLKWETTTASDAGLDIGFLKDRLSLTVDVYYKKTSNLLQNLLIPPSTGFNNITTNYGNVTNKGLEISVVATPVKTEKFSWNLNANISFNRNKISGLRGDQFGHRLWSGIDQVFLQRNGMPIGAILGYVEDGFYDNEAEVRADPAYANKGDAVIRSMIGEIKYKNLDNDPSSIGASDRTIIGNTNPNYSYGITNNLNYKNLSLSFFIQGVQGKQLINSNLLNVTMGEMGNITQAAWDGRWTPDNYANATWQKPNSSYNRRRYFSNKIIEDGSYLRLKNVNLGYVFRTPFKGIETINLFANVSNVFTVTKYSWYDPDVNSFANDPSSRGVDMNAYPNTRTYTIGLKTVF